MKEIPLTQGKVALVDDEDYERINKHKWYARKGVYTFYAQRYVTKNGKDIVIGMHHQVLGVIEARPRTDHKDQNGLNNQKHNLRPCTRNQNAMNQCPRRGKKYSDYKGVHLKYYISKKKSTKWFSCIRVNNKLIHLGYFFTEIDAAKAYDEAARKYFGEFAGVNLK
jgi:hypothetical protein